MQNTLWILFALCLMMYGIVYTVGGKETADKAMLFIWRHIRKAFKSFLIWLWKLIRPQLIRFGVWLGSLIKRGSLALWRKLTT